MSIAPPAIKRRPRIWPRVVVLLLCAVAVWTGVDLLFPSTADLRHFDGHEVGRLETAMWRSYYDHKPLLLFRKLAELLRSQYRFGWPSSMAGAWYAARAAVVFQRGHNRGEYELALPALRGFYGMIRRRSASSFNVEAASRKELEWWIVHRERAQHESGDLERSLADLQAEIYKTPADAFSEHAKSRAEAMLIRDSKAAAGGVSEDHWKRISELLDASWTSLSRTVERK